MTPTHFSPVQSGNAENPGVIPQAVTEIFSYIQCHPEQTFLLRASYLEIYNETLKDLLAPESGPLKVRQDENVSAAPSLRGKPLLTAAPARNASSCTRSARRSSPARTRSPRYSSGGSRTATLAGQISTSAAPARTASSRSCVSRRSFIKPVANSARYLIRRSSHAMTTMSPRRRRRRCAARCPTRRASRPARTASCA